VARITGQEVAKVDLREKAREMLRYFKKADDGRVLTVDGEAGKPARELALYVHQQLSESLPPPDDWTFEEIYYVLHHIADGNDLDEYPEADIYNSDRLRWLASCPYAVEYVDDARREFGHGESVLDDIGHGQYLARRTIADAVARYLGADSEDDDDETDD